MSDRVFLLANPASGRGRGAAAAGQIADELRRRGVEPTILLGTSPEEALDGARRAVDEHADRLVVAGGDGVVHLAVQALATTETALGIVPVGSGNDFAGGLGLPSSIAEATAAALGDPSPVDLLRIDTTWAASVATLGFSAGVNERANRMRWPRGSLRYSAATIAELRHLHATPLALSIDGEAVEARISLLAIANTTDFGGGMHISPHADPTDGKADITVVGPASRMALLWLFRKVFDGSHLDHPAVWTRTAYRIDIDTPGLAIWADGEPVTTTPARIEVVPGALLVAGIVPS